MIASKEGLRLAPFYDLMCTRVYSGLSPNFAFKIGEHFNAGDINNNDILLLAKAINVTPRYIISIATDILDKVKEGIPQAAKNLSATSGHGEKVIIERMVFGINSIARKMGARILDDPHF
jgi:serine/threonine-protein kinase HipA